MLALREPKGKNRAGHEYKRLPDAQAVREDKPLGDYYFVYNQASPSAVSLTDLLSIKFTCPFFSLTWSQLFIYNNSKSETDC